MKLLPFLLLAPLLLAACATNKTTGKREYVGPPIGSKICYSKKGVRYCATYDTAKGVWIEVELGDFKSTR